tara:strand:- start:3930 stop:6119 length:2190 start_codon:yes stop_codon:yes gene_type:complete
MKRKFVTDLQIKEAKATDKRRRLACGRSLYVMIEPISKALNSKSFIGNIRFPSGRKGKQIEVRIGTYGKGINQYTLKQARDEWDRLRKISKERNEDPRTIQKEEKTGNNYTTIAKKDLISEKYQEFELNSKKLFLSKHKEKYYLISRTCPHQGGLIINQGERLICPLHNWYFSSSGKCLNSSQNAFSIELKIKNDYLLANNQKLKELGLEEVPGENVIRNKVDIKKINNLPLLKLHSHATLELDFKDLNILFDPWLDGPAMLGSWRQYPKPIISGKDLEPDIIIITHEHSDHFHLPTLKAIGKDRLIIFPNFNNNRIKSFLDSNGFINYNCIDFNKKITLGPQLHVTFFRPKHIFNDSIVLLEKNLFRFLNLNDAGLNPEIANKVGPVHLISCIFSTGASGYPLTWTHVNHIEKKEIMRSACLGRLQMLEQALSTYESDYILPFASHIKLWLEEHDNYRKNLISNSINEVIKYFREKGKLNQLIDMIPGDEYSLNKSNFTRKYYNRKYLYESKEIESLIIKDRNSYKGDLISWDSCNILINRKLIVDHFTKELSSEDDDIKEDLYLICKVHGGFSETFIFRFTNGKFVDVSSINEELPIIKMKIKDKIIMNIISGYLSWDEAKVGYWIEWWRNTDKVHNALTRAMQSPILPLDRSHLWRFKDRKTIINLSISELIRKNKKIDSVLKTHGLFCTGCALSPWETIEDAAEAHGLSQITKKQLFKDLNKLIK